jgi:hypothetical protein
MKERPLKTKLQIHQIYFREEQLSKLEPLFSPYFKPELEEPEWREYWTFLKNHKKAIASNGYTGYVSWKFTAKSGVSAAKFIRFILDNPGYDVYFLNPFPLDAVLFQSIWKHGEYYHPGLTEISQTIMDKAGYKINLQQFVNSPQLTAYSNYWVGNSKFWRQYIAFTRPLAEYIRNNLNAQERAYIFSIADPVSKCSHIPFIMERLFTTLLVLDKNLKSISYQYDTEDLHNRYSLPERYAYRILVRENTRNHWTGRLLISVILLARRLKDKMRNFIMR